MCLTIVRVEQKLISTVVDIDIYMRNIDIDIDIIIDIIIDIFIDIFIDSIFDTYIDIILILRAKVTRLLDFKN